MTDAPFTPALTPKQVTAIEDDYAMDEREAADRIRELLDDYRAALAEIARLTAENTRLNELIQQSKGNP